MATQKAIYAFSTVRGFLHFLFIYLYFYEILLHSDYVNNLPVILIDHPGYMALCSHPWEKISK